jgi:sugar phosphate isomerase/epimerase
MATRRTFIEGATAISWAIASDPLARSAAPVVADPRGRSDSKIAGVQIGVITYSFRSMPDQSALAVLGYCLKCGIDAIELMGDPAEAYAGLAPYPHMERYLKARYRNVMPNPPPLTPDQEKEQSEILADFAGYREQAAAWRASVSMTAFEKLRKMYQDSGVRIYAFKPSAFESDSTDAEVQYGMRAAKALGATHVTVELPADPAQSLRLGEAAARHGLMVGYHAHLQATPQLWDTALTQSRANGINLDLGHYAAAGNVDALEFIQTHHARITSMHLKDRRGKTDGQANEPWGQGATPLVAVLRLMRDRRYSFPAAIELEYDIPPGSDAVAEVRKCLSYCRQALETG